MARVKCDSVGCYLNALKKFLADPRSDRLMQIAVRLAREAGRNFDDDLAHVRRGENVEDVVRGRFAANTLPRYHEFVGGHWEGQTFVVTHRVKPTTY